MTTARLDRAQINVLDTLADLAAGRITSGRTSPSAGDAVEPDCMTNAQADNEYASDADYAAAAVLG